MPLLSRFPADAPPWLTPAVHVVQGTFVGLCAVLGTLGWGLGLVFVLAPPFAAAVVLGAPGLAALYTVAVALPRLRTRGLTFCAAGLASGLLAALPWIWAATEEPAWWLGAVFLVPPVVGAAVALLEIALCLSHRRRIARGAVRDLPAPAD